MICHPEVLNTLYRRQALGCLTPMPIGCFHPNPIHPSIPIGCFLCNISCHIRPSRLDVSYVIFLVISIFILIGCFSFNISWHICPSQLDDVSFSFLLAYPFVRPSQLYFCYVIFLGISFHPFLGAICP